MNDEQKQALLKQLPSVADILDQAALLERVGPDMDRHSLKTAVRDEIAVLRSALLDGRSTDPTLDLDRVARRARRLAEPSLLPVINATGVVVHTNLGRSPLPPPVAERVLRLACGYTNLEYDLDAGVRGHRHVHASRLVQRITGAEAALVVNNCAAAVLLCLTGLARNREVIVSRGELVEIGGAFRVPDVMVQSGARLVEVGTTNRTRISDYRAAITPDTGLLLKVHRSNFAVVGFTDEVSPAELSELGRDHGLPTMMDLGSGLHRRPPGPSFLAEPEIAEITRSGVDVLTFSGDKLLGGPQAGIIAGRTDIVRTLSKHPLLRALRPDKLTFGALEGVLALHAAGRAAEEVPTVRMLSEDVAAVAGRRDELLRLLSENPLPASVSVTSVDTTSRPGGGSLPLSELPSAGICVTHSNRSAAELHHHLRQGRPALVGRIEDDRLILDLRTVLPGELDAVAGALGTLDAEPYAETP
ncbi:MAG: L-seryl-tRNA(Sec) selenium transferase [bacterium]